MLASLSHIKIYHHLMTIIYVHSVNWITRCRSFLATVLMHFGKYNIAIIILRAFLNWLLGIYHGRHNSYTTTKQLKTTHIWLYRVHWPVKNWVSTTVWMSCIRYLYMQIWGKLNGKCAEILKYFMLGWSI